MVSIMNTKACRVMMTIRCRMVWLIRRSDWRCSSNSPTPVPERNSAHFLDLSFTVRSRVTIHDREQYLQEAESLLQHQDWKFFEISDADVAFHGDAAVVTYIARVSGKDPQEMYFESKLRVMDIYAKTGGEWNLAASHVSLHPDEIDKRLSAAISALTLA